MQTEPVVAAAARPETHPDAWERFQKTMDKTVPSKRKPKKDETDKGD